MTNADDRVYYVISDLHIGGDEQLEEVEFRDELIAFLDRLADTDENAELVVNGDAFGLWEFTGVEGIEKFDIIEETYPEILDAFRRAGENVDVTFLPGNHDHELAAYDAYVDRLAEYNVDLVQDQSVERRVGDSAIHFEHGHQRDPNNRIDDWGNPASTPLGYYYNTHVTSRAGQLSDRGRFNWLKDVQAVTPTERMPVWLFSKYFYREMNPALRYALVPFLLLFNLSALVAIGAGLDLAGVWNMPVERTTEFLSTFGVAGTAAYYLLAVNVAVVGLLLLVYVPYYFLKRDFKQTVQRFGVLETDLTVDAEHPYRKAAREVFDEDPETAVFCYGHTHRPKCRELDGGLLVNTGTWLKRLHRRDGVIGILPPVFYPSYRIPVVRIAADGGTDDEGTDDGGTDDGGTDDGTIDVTYEPIEKPSPAPEELTLTERLLTIGRAPDEDLPDGATYDPSENTNDGTARNE